MLRTRTCGFVCAAVFAMLTAATADAADADVLAAQKKRVQVVQTVAPSVVAIFGPGGRGGGSGVLISPDGYALTNFHVTRGAGTFMKCGLNDGKLYDAVIVGIDPTGDVAMVKLLGRTDFPFAKLGDSDKLKAGDWAFAMGNPFLLATDFKPSVTYGIVSGIHRYQYPAGKDFLEYTDCIQIDTSINPGNSGGPLFNDDGGLVGINGRGSFEKRGRVNSGAGYAISINQIKHFMGHLRSGRIVDHATLGATVETTDSGSVRVSNILEESEAFRRGLEIGDDIIAFAGRRIRSVNQYKNILGIYPKGWKLPLVYLRGNKEHTIYVRLRALHRDSDFSPAKKEPAPRPGGKKPIPGRPIPLPKPKAAPTVPEQYKHLFVKRDGYTNYYFNELEQKRTLRAVGTLGDFSKMTGNWKLAGKTDKGVSFRFLVTSQQLVGEIGMTPYVQKLDKKLEPWPRGSGGLLAAMMKLKLFLTNATLEKTTFDLSYLGTEPLDGRGETVDVIVTILVTDANQKIMSRWYFHPQDGRLLGFDTQIDEDADECQIRIASFKSFNGRQLPEKMTVRYAERMFATLTLESAELAAGTEKPKKPAAKKAEAGAKTN